MALQDLVGSECGRSHPLTQLTSHFLLDQAHEERGLCRPSSSQEADELVQEYLEEVYGPKARSFCMDSLFQEMTQIESGEFPQVPTPRGPTAADEPDLEAVGSTWVQEYLGSRKPFNEEYHEEEVWRTSYKPEISRIQSTFHHGFDSIWTPDHFQTDERNIDIDENWLQESEADEERQGSLQELAKMFLNSVDDPKLKGSKFMKFMQQVGNGDISISGGKVMEHTSSELGDGNISNIIEEVSESTSKDNGTFCTTTVENSSVTPSEKPGSLISTPGPSISRPGLSISRRDLFVVWKNSTKPERIMKMVSCVLLLYDLKDSDEQIMKEIKRNLVDKSSKFYERWIRSSKRLSSSERKHKIWLDVNIKFPQKLYNMFHG